MEAWRPSPPLPSGPAPLPADQPDARTSATLLVKHLPDALPIDTLTRLFSHYGASDFRPCVAGRLKNCAFVDFKDEAQAARAQSQLHRLRFLGKILAVERAKPKADKAVSDNSDAFKDANAEHNDQPPPLPPYPPPHPQGGRHLSSASKTTPAVAGVRNESIAPTLGVDYPFPPHLEYAYPPPDGNILTNIVNALIAVPRFYTQVLHLMNKMNLPAPFRPALPTPPLPPPPPAPAAPKRQAEDLSSDESELESSEETGTNAMEEAPETEVGTTTWKTTRKRLKVEKSEDVGAKPALLVPKEKLTIKKTQPILQINISAKGLPKGQMHDKIGLSLEEADHPVKEETVEARNTATREELEAGRMPANELLVLPMFKNYARGMPTPVLYVKNLAKDVTQEDLYFVFGAVFPESEDFKSHLGVKLMQEGRMRGQAFVSFPSTDLAQDALNTVHGYILKGKPVIVQFGRNPAAAKSIAD